jgi:hypothetical protein
VKDDAMPVAVAAIASGTIPFDAPVVEQPSTVARYARVST